jgi:hypothetical protein
MRITHTFDRWMYRGGRPNRAARLLNRVWAVAYAVGLWPRRLGTLEVPGRRTGRLISFPVVIADLDGGARAHIPVDRHAPVEELAPIAARIPVFRITPVFP